MKSSSIVLLAMICVFAIESSSAGECVARAAKNGAEIDDGQVLTQFTVTPSDCGGSCKGHVEYRLHFKDKDKENHFYSGMVAWNSRKGVPADVVHKGFHGYCSDRSLGPCRVSAVEVLKVSCFN